MQTVEESGSGSEDLGSTQDDRWRVPDRGFCVLFFVSYRTLNSQPHEVFSISQFFHVKIRPNFWKKGSQKKLERVKPDIQTNSNSVVVTCWAETQACKP